MKTDVATEFETATTPESSAQASRGPQAGVAGVPVAPRKRKLSRAGAHFLVDVLLLVAFLVLVWVSAVLEFLFPPATKAGSWTLWGLDYDGWSMVRFASLCVFCLMTLVHLILQWNWVCHFIVSRVSRATDRKITVAPAVRTLYGVGSLIVILTILGILLAAAEFAIKSG